MLAAGKGMGKPAFRIIQTHFAAANNVGDVAAKEEVQPPSCCSSQCIRRAWLHAGCMRCGCSSDMRIQRRPCQPLRQSRMRDIRCCIFRSDNMMCRYGRRAHNY